MKNNTVIVTGGAGFLGSHLVDRLIKEGHKVVVIDNLSTGKKENLPVQAKFYKIDIQNPEISRIFKKEKPEIVFHLAAKIGVRKSSENPAITNKTNILGSLNMLENCRKFKIKKLIFASSVGVYGQAKILPIKENQSLNPISPYAISKLVIEKYLNYYQSQGLNFVSLRFSNIYGPRQSTSGEGGVIAIFINKIIRGERPIIFGKGNQTRDFLYVADAVEAAILALRALTGSIYPVRKSTFSNGVYNVGTNKEISIKKLFELISFELNKKIKPIFKPLSQGEILKSRIDYSKIKKELGWQPEYNLEKGLKETIK